MDFSPAFNHFDDVEKIEVEGILGTQPISRDSNGQKSSYFILILETSALTYAYRSGKHLRFPDLKINAGEKVLLIGASGSGKSSL